MIAHAPAPKGYTVHEITKSGKVVPPAPMGGMDRMLVLVGGHWIAAKHCPDTVTVGAGVTFAVPERKK